MIGGVCASGGGRLVDPLPPSLARPHFRPLTLVLPLARYLQQQRRRQRRVNRECGGGSLVFPLVLALLRADASSSLTLVPKATQPLLAFCRDCGNDDDGGDGGGGDDDDDGGGGGGDDDDDGGGGGGGDGV